MTMSSGSGMLDALVRRWRRGQRFALLIRGLAVALPIVVLAWVLLPGGDSRPLVALLLGLGAAVASRWLPAPPPVDERLMAEHLDRVLPELEDSAGLFVRSPQELSKLERLQWERILPLLERAVEEHLWPRAQVARALRVLVAGLLLTTLVGVVRWTTASIPVSGETAKRGAAPEQLDPFGQLEVEVEPPAYTKRPPRRQLSLDVTAEEGATVRWRLPDVSQAAELVFADGDRLVFATDAVSAVVQVEASENRVYHLATMGGEDEIRSSYARLEVVPDLPPRLEILAPETRVTTLSATAGEIALTLEAEDDYGLEALEMVTTLAKGSGELVEFREQRAPIRLQEDASGTRYQSMIDFGAAELEAGSELYFYVEARDNRPARPNVSRTPTYILRLPGEELATSDLDGGLPVVLPPEYFRSQRQIILDTEALIAAKPELSSTEFAQRSESLGFDQRALRMRYGILLGEEFESGRPIEADEEHADHDDEESPIEGLPAELFHLHDSAEIATFFTNEIRTQLKRVLAEMWDAEGELRFHRPPEALPYEYRALELLKDLQQRSRLYVQKVGFETPPLEPETMRLTGELDDIGTRHRTVEPAALDPLAAAVKELSAALNRGLGVEEQVTTESTTIVRSHLARQAVDDPEVLPALEALDRWARGETLRLTDRQSLAHALWRLTPPDDAGPGRVAAAPDPLAQLYRSQLSAKEDS